MRAGHYLESRSENKVSSRRGGLWYMAACPLLFVGSERGNMVGRNTIMRRPGATRIIAVITDQRGPEGFSLYRRVTSGVSSEVDSAGDGIRSTLAIYRYGAKRRFYPQIASG